MLSEEDYNSLIESLYLACIPGMYESIVEGVNTPVEEYVKVEWK
jgi:PHD/YefM family antitoxin component YafN of YafNO toxin-antitoxin module